MCQVYKCDYTPCIGTGKEGTMCTAFSYCRSQKQRLRGFGINAPRPSGSFGSGPWAIRPKRLQWLSNIRAGFKIAAFPVLMVVGNHSLSTVMPAQACTQLLSRKTGRKLGHGHSLPRATTRGRGDGVENEIGTNFNTSRALPHFSYHLRILIGRKAMAETSPPFFILGAVP
jgi:hypothetical protein